MSEQKNYYKNTRLELAHQLSRGDHKVLELGCAEGALGGYLKEHGLATEVIGIELSPDAAKIAETRLDRVICGDLEALNRHELGLDHDSFDYIICGDVVEHLRNPWEALRWLSLLLKKDGNLIMSVPNVRHWSVSLSLLFFGQWKYRPQGILDRTHLRFFTKQSLVDTISDANLVVVNIKPLMYRKVDRLGDVLTFRSLGGIFAFQWLAVAKRKSH